MSVETEWKCKKCVISLPLPFGFKHHCHCKTSFPSTHQHCYKKIGKYAKFCCHTYPLGHEHCCKCKIDWDPKTQFHCCECKKTWDNINNIHFVSKQKCFVYPANHDICTICEKSYDPGQESHCVIISKKRTRRHPDNNYTCYNWKHAESRHCNICHCIYKRNLQHCCKCKINWDPLAQNHCASCHKSWNPKTEQHHDQCHTIYPIGQEHCCRCKINWDPNVNQHHNQCHTTYPIGQEHCCGCKSNWDPKINQHHNQCHTTYSIGQEHCCGCKSNWDPKINQHHNQCHTTYPINSEHCCQCKKTYHKSSNHCCKCGEWGEGCIHCAICHNVFSQSEKDRHCCICGTTNCQCDNLTLVLRDTIEKMGGFAIGSKFLFSPCFGKCAAMKKFIAGINHIRNKTTLNDFIKHKDNFIIVNHGTPSVESAFRICCQSLSVLHRRRQYCGSGEYFSSGPRTAKDYAGHHGAIVKTLLINPNICGDNIKIVNDGDHGEDWYVVDNTSNMSFALPIGIVETGPSIDNIGNTFCIEQKTKDIIKKVSQGAKMIISFNGDNGFQPYDSSVHDTIVKAFMAQKQSCEIRTNNYTYTIDFAYMTQINQKTKGSRNIKIDLAQSSMESVD
jgi:WWE domain